MLFSWKRQPVRKTRVLTFEVLEDRVVLDATLPNAVDDSFGYNVLQPSSPVAVLANDQNEAGASWNFASLTVVSSTQHGSLTLDSITGVFLYTPTPLPASRPGSPPPAYPQDSFTYNVRNNLGNQTNTASVALFPIAGPKVGYILAQPDLAVTSSLQPVVIDLLANDELRNDPTHPNDPGAISDWQFDYGSVKITSPEFNAPKHGTVTFNPTTGAATYTPDFGYIGWDRFVYDVSTMPGAPNGPLPGTVFSSSDEVFVIINGAAPRLQSDPFGGQMVVVDGTNQADAIAIVPGARPREVKAIVNGVASPSFRPTGRVVVFGYGSNDSLFVSPAVRNPVWLIGGSENDVLMAGGGPSLLMGGDGDDTLLGGLGRDLLIGGAGKDSLTSGFGGDVFIGGTTRFDSQPTALGDIFSLWAWLPRPATPKVAGKPTPRTLLTNADVLDDGKKDTLVGRRGIDKIFATTTEVADEVIIRTKVDRGAITRFFAFSFAAFFMK